MGLRGDYVMRVSILAYVIGYLTYFNSHYRLAALDSPSYFNCQITAANGTEDDGSEGSV